MADSFWRTKADLATRKSIQWPSLTNILSQLGLALVIGLVWVGLFWGFLQFTGASSSQSAAPPATDVVLVEPEASPTLPPPTATAPPPTATPPPSPTPPSTTEPEAAPTETVAPEADPPTSTPAPTMTPIPTEPPLPATDTPAPPPAEDTAQVSFAADVFPIIEDRCVKCHGGEKTEEGLRMTSYDELMQGSWNGLVIEPGDAANSFLVEQITNGKMPKNEPHLLPAQIRIISDWIDAGALDN